MYIFENEKGDRVTLSKEEINLYKEYKLDKSGIKYRDISCIEIPKDTGNSYYLVSVDYNNIS